MIVIRDSALFNLCSPNAYNIHLLVYKSYYHCLEPLKMQDLLQKTLKTRNSL